MIFMRDTTYKSPDMSRCADCLYHFAAADPDCYRAVMPACVYILRTGRRRPCPAGAGCTEYRRLPSLALVYRERLRREYQVFHLKKGAEGRGR